jgi:hypothetical protein
MCKANARAQCVHFVSSQNKEMVPNLSELWDALTKKNTDVKINNEVYSKSIHCYCTYLTGFHIQILQTNIQPSKANTILGYHTVQHKKLISLHFKHALL